MSLSLLERASARHRKLVKTNRWDDAAWHTARRTKPVSALYDDLFAGDAHYGGARRGFEPTQELLEGLYQTFFKAGLEYADPGELERDLYPVLKVLEQANESPRLGELREFTYNNEVMSTIAVSAMSDVLQDLILELQQIDPPPPPGDSGEGGSSGKPQEVCADCEGTGRGPSGSAGDCERCAGEGFADQPDDGSDQAEADWEAAFDEALDDAHLESRLEQAMNDAIDEMEETESRRRNAGLEDGEWKSMTPDERLELAEWLMTPEMKALSDMIGRVKRYAQGIRAEKIIEQPDMIYDVEYGDRIRDVLLTEFALLGHPIAKLEFYRRLVEKQLLQFKKRGKQKVGKGPLEVLIDKSLSMQGKKFHWAMGCAEALRRFAGDEGRDYHSIFFGTNNDRTRFFFPKGIGPFEKVRAFLSAAADGGTEFDGVLTEGLKRASEAYDQEGLSKADLVFITDGNAKLSDAWIENFNKERARVGVRVFVIFITGADDTSVNPLPMLEKISDLAIPVSALEPDSMREVFARI